MQGACRIRLCRQHKHERMVPLQSPTSSALTSHSLRDTCRHPEQQGNAFGGRSQRVSEQLRGPQQAADGRRKTGRNPGSKPLYPREQTSFHPCLSMRNCFLAPLSMPSCPCPPLPAPCPHIQVVRLLAAADGAALVKVLAAQALGLGGGRHVDGRLCVWGGVGGVGVWGGVWGGELGMQRRWPATCAAQASGRRRAGACLLLLSVGLVELTRTLIKTPNTLNKP